MERLHQPSLEFKDLADSEHIATHHTLVVRPHRSGSSSPQCQRMVEKELHAARNRKFGVFGKAIAFCIGALRNSCLRIAQYLGSMPIADAHDGFLPSPLYQLFPSGGFLPSQLKGLGIPMALFFGAAARDFGENSAPSCTLSTLSHLTGSADQSLYLNTGQ